MKKHRIILLTALAATAMASCDSETKETTAMVNYVTCNLVTPLDGGPTTASKGMYAFDFNLTQAKASVSTKTLSFDGKSYNSFETDQVPFAQYPPYDGMVYYMKGFTGNVNDKTSLDIRNAEFLITSQFVFAMPGWNPEHPGLLYSGNIIYPVVVASYQIGDEYRVKTFASDSFYSGETTTTYPNMTGGTDSYLNKDMYYRVLIDVEKSKADVIIYKAKFSASPKEPEKAAVYLKDLDITYGDGYYVITGKDIVPKLYEGGQLEDYPSFTFRNFRMMTTGYEMNGADMDYTVDNTVTAGMTMTYTGHFKGFTVSLPDTGE